MENMEVMDREPGQLDCHEKADETGEILLPVMVLRKILENLSNADLLNLSLVNKEWNYETRSVLRDRGSLTAKLNADGGRCKDLRAFASDLRRMKELRKIVPLSGLTIAFGVAADQHGDWCEESATGELDRVYEDILHHIQWKHLVLHWKNLSVQKENCPGFMLMKKILHNCSGVLEEFSLEFLCDNLAFIPKFIQDCNFSRLKTLIFATCFVRFEDLIKKLVSHAPNLKVVWSKGAVDVRVNLLEGRPAAVHLTDYPYCPSRDGEIPASIFDQLRLRRLRLTSANQDLNAERLSRVLPKLLEKSRTTLSWMQTDAIFLAPLMSNAIYLKNVQQLTLPLSHSDISQPHSRGFLESFDFNRVFPNLGLVHVHTCNDYPVHERVWNSFIGLVDQGNATLIEPDERNVNVKKLTLAWCPPLFSRDNRAARDRFLVKMFPHIKTLHISTDGVPLVHFWDYWLNLDELVISLLPMRDIDQNLDSAFCGIFPEEVAELRERDEEYLRSVNIVPVMPSLACLKRLKTFRLWIHDRSCLGGDPTSELSKVTGWIAFKRRPDLTVTLATYSQRLRRGLQPMEPYASVRLIE